MMALLLAGTIALDPGASTVRGAAKVGTAGATDGAVYVRTSGATNGAAGRATVAGGAM